MKKEDIFNYLREQEFTEEELGELIDDLVFENRVDAANKAVAQFIESQRRFKDKREQRLRQEFRDKILPELNEDRARIKFERAQETYKINRKKKKLLQKNGKRNNIQLSN